MTAFTGGGYGSGPRLSATGFLSLGLITFWVYTVLRFASALRTHCERRWAEIEVSEPLKGADPALVKAFRARGFTVTLIVPRCAAGLFALCAVLVSWWFTSWILLGNVYSYNEIIAAIGLSSLLFYAASLVIMLWALGAVRQHETNELLWREIGMTALKTHTAEPGDELVRRWERQASRIVLFLVVALPISCSPMLGAHLLLVGEIWGQELLMPSLCFALAAVFHVCGIMLLVGLYNDHLSFEAQQASITVNPAGNRSIPAAMHVEDGAAPSRELAAIMLTDMCGYSKAMEHDEARAYAKLGEHNQIMRGAIATHHGREIKTIGDAFLVIFKSAIDAVDCALTVQRAFVDFNLGKSETDQVLVRIGIHIGDVLVTNNDVFGDGINVVARIEPHAEPGGICISEPVFEMVRKKLQLEVSKVEGAKLKNIAVAPDLYRIRLGP